MEHVVEIWDYLESLLKVDEKGFLDFFATTFS